MKRGICCCWRNRGQLKIRLTLIGGEVQQTGETFQFDRGEGGISKGFHGEEKEEHFTIGGLPDPTHKREKCSIKRRLGRPIGGREGGGVRVKPKDGKKTLSKGRKTAIGGCGRIEGTDLKNLKKIIIFRGKKRVRARKNSLRGQRGHSARTKWEMKVRSNGGGGGFRHKEIARQGLRHNKTK